MTAVAGRAAPVAVLHPRGVALKGADGVISPVLQNDVAVQTFISEGRLGGHGTPGRALQFLANKPGCGMRSCGLGIHLPRLSNAFSNAVGRDVVYVSVLNAELRGPD